MIVKECSQKYYDKLLSKNKIDSDTLYVIKSTYKELEAENKKLKEANEVIDACCSLPETNWIVIDSYKEKWGVK